MRISASVLASILAVAACGAALLWRREASRASGAAVEIERLRAASADLAHQLARARAVAPAPLEPGGAGESAPPVKPGTIERTVIREDTATRNELVKLLDEKQASIVELHKSRDEWEARLREAEARIAALGAEQQRFAGVEREWKERLDAAQRASADLEAEAKGRGERAARADEEIRGLRKRADDAARKLGAVTKAASAIEDLARRRDGHLTNLLRRYRELTDLYRTLAVRSNNARDVAAPAATTDLSRIQTAVQLAEDDLRQLQTLSAQAALLHKELAAAAR